MLVEALRGAGQDVTFYKIGAADHGDPSFWKPATVDLVVDFIEQHGA
jgi:hypothetical protein